MKTGESVGKPNALLDSLFEQYKDQYTFLTMDMLVDTIRKNTKSKGVAGEVSHAKGDYTEEDDKQEEDEILSRIIAIVDLSMRNYNLQIKALKRSREKNEADVLSKERRELGVRVTSSSLGKPEAVKRSVKDIQENFLFEEILEKYSLERETTERLSDGLFSLIVEVTKKEHQMELDMPLKKLKDIIRSRYDEKMAKEENGNCFRKNYTQLLEEVFRRYSLAMEVHGGRLPAEELISIAGEVTREYGIAGVNISNLRMRIQKRFAKENPDFKCVMARGGITKAHPEASSDEREERHRRLLDEIAVRFAREGGGQAELPDRT